MPSKTFYLPAPKNALAIEISGVSRPSMHSVVITTTDGEIPTGGTLTGNIRSFSKFYGATNIDWNNTHVKFFDGSSQLKHQSANIKTLLLENFSFDIRYLTKDAGGESWSLTSALGLYLAFSNGYIELKPNGYLAYSKPSSGGDYNFSDWGSNGGGSAVPGGWSELNSLKFRTQDNLNQFLLSQERTRTINYTELDSTRYVTTLDGGVLYNGNIYYDITNTVRYAEEFVLSSAKTFNQMSIFGSTEWSPSGTLTLEIHAVTALALVSSPNRTPEASVAISLTDSNVFTSDGDWGYAIFGKLANATTLQAGTYTFAMKYQGSSSLRFATYTSSGSTLRTGAAYASSIANTSMAFLMSTVTAANNAPTNISLSLSTIAENQAIGTTVGTLLTTDPDAGNTFTYSLSGTDAASFSITGSSLKTAAVFNYEVKSSYSINVISTDQGGLTYTKAFTISVTNVNERPASITLSASSIAENNAIGAAVGTLSAINPDTGLELPFSIKNGFIFSSSALSAFNAAHSGTVQEIVLKTTDNLAPSTSNLGNNVNLDYTKSYVKVGGVKYYAYTVAGNVRSSSGTQMGLVGNDLSASTSSSFNYGINFNGGWVLTFSSSSVSLNKYDAMTDMDTTGYFSFTGSRVFASLPAWVDKFQISGSQLQAKMAFDYESAASHSVVVEATDTDGVSIEQTFTISVTNANEAPTNISLSLSTIAENNAINAVVGTLLTTDPDAGNTFTYSLSGTDAASFNISGNSLRASVVFDYEAKSSYSINVISTDQGGLTYTKAFTISVTNDASDDSVLVSSASMTSGKVVALVGVSPRDIAVRVVISGVEQALPEGSVVKNTTNGQKFVKVAGAETEFSAISIAAPLSWGWTQEGKDAWNILQSL